MSPGPRPPATDLPEPRLLIAAANSARAIAESALRGGYAVQVLDGFCDQDTRDLAPCTQVPMAGLGLDAAPILAATERLLERLPGTCPPDAGVGLVYGAGFESCPAVLEALARRVRLLGNDPGVLTLLSDPGRLLALLERLGIRHPETRLEPPPAGPNGGPPTAPAGTPWLVKETAASGGLGVRPWRPGDPRPLVPHCFQRRLPGVPMSALFVADGRTQIPIGFNRLLVADADPGHPFLFGGVLGQAEPDPAVRREVEGWCAALTAALGLRGVNGLDFILHLDRPWLLELNPRPTAALSLYDPLCEGGWIRRHVRACLGELPPAPAAHPGRVWGQRILYAPRDLDLPAGIVWPAWCRDRPVAGARVPAGTPLCTVLADTPDQIRTELLLALRAIAVLDLIQRAGRPDRDREPGP